jgi:hypothetical protein
MARSIAADLGVPSRRQDQVCSITPTPIPLTSRSLHAERNSAAHLLRVLSVRIVSSTKKGGSRSGRLIPRGSATPEGGRKETTFSGGVSCRSHVRTVLVRISVRPYQPVVKVEIAENIPQGLKRLRKKARFRAKSPKSMPQGLKPILFS